MYQTHRPCRCPGFAGAPGVSAHDPLPCSSTSIVCAANDMHVTRSYYTHVVVVTVGGGLEVLGRRAPVHVRHPEPIEIEASRDPGAIDHDAPGPL